MESDLFASFFLFQFKMFCCNSSANNLLFHSIGSNMESDLFASFFLFFFHISRCALISHKNTRKTDETQKFRDIELDVSVIIPAHTNFSQPQKSHHQNRA